MFARFINILIGTWVLVAAFAFQSGTVLFTCMLIVGLGVMAFESLAFFSNRLRFVTSALGVVLLLSGFVLPSSDTVTWNNFFCGVAIFVLSMVRSKLKWGPWVPEAHRREAEAR